MLMFTTGSDIVEGDERLVSGFERDQWLISSFQHLLKGKSAYGSTANSLRRYCYKTPQES
jgi:hypothetical protein